MAAKYDLGRRGEQIAVEYLTNRGFVVLDRNWRCRDGEIDVVASDRGKLVVCEVKTRSGVAFGDPVEAVTASKAIRIRRVTQAWLRTHRVRWCELRFDIVAIVVPPEGDIAVQHYEAAF